MIELFDNIIKTYYNPHAIANKAPYAYSRNDYLKSLEIAAKLETLGIKTSCGTLTIVSEGRAVSEPMPKLIENRIFPHVAKKQTRPERTALALFTEIIRSTLLTVRDSETEHTTKHNARQTAEALIRKISRASANCEKMIFYRAVEIKPIKTANKQRYSVHAHLIVSETHEKQINEILQRTIQHAHSEKIKSTIALATYIHKCQIEQPATFTAKQLAEYMKITTKLRTHQALGMFSEFLRYLEKRKLKTVQTRQGLEITDKTNRITAKRANNGKKTKTINRPVKLTKRGVLVLNYDQKTANGMFNSVAGVTDITENEQLTAKNSITVQRIQKLAQTIIAPKMHPQLIPVRGRPRTAQNKKTARKMKRDKKTLNNAPSPAKGGTKRAKTEKQPTLFDQPQQPQQPSLFDNDNS